MKQPVRKVGVIGAGVMGSGIAAHFANAGVRVELLDIVPPNLSDGDKKKPSARNAIADGALKATLKARPAPFFHKSRALLVSTGNLEDHLDRLADCDLVIEAIIERLDIKKNLLERLEGVVSDTAIIASNTSGLRIADMLEGRSESFRKRFVVMHFFNPVRYMKLLELVAGPDTDDAVMNRVEHLGKELLGKGIVVGKDTPNFVGNRIGVHSLMSVIHQMIEDKLSPEDVDAITGLPMGHPKSASFRTGDMVGIDTFVHVADNCYDVLKEDEEREVFKVPDYIRKMVEQKLLGGKTKQGFYKKTKEGILTFDPYTLEYRPKGGDDSIKKLCKDISKVEDPAERIRKLVADEGPAGKYAWKVISRGLAYSARRIGEITDEIKAVDDSMRWGYNWELGPFEIWDAIGFRESYDRMVKEGVDLPDAVKKMYESGATSFYTEDGKAYDLTKGKYVALDADPREVTLDILRKSDSPVLSNGSAEAWDIGDGVLAVKFKSKANSIDADNIGLLDQAVDKAEQDFRALLIANEGEHFCVGANLFMIVMAANQKQWDSIRETSGGLQRTLQKVKYSHIPVVAAPFGMALGGGLELCLSCDAVQAAAETYSGLVEVGVGLLPGGAGNLNLLWRALESKPEGVDAPVDHYVNQVFKNIAMAKVCTSAVEGQKLGYFRVTDGVSFDKARLLTEAKAKAIGLAESGYHPPVPKAYRLPGESGVATLDMMVSTLVAGGYASEHDAKISHKIANVLCGGAGGSTHEVTEDEILELEREAFVSLCGEQKSLDRMQHMLMKNKPLRN